MELWQIILLCTIVAIIAAVIASIRTRRRDIKKVAYMMDALEDGELNFRFQEKNQFNRTLNRIRTIFEKQRQAHEQDSWTKLIRVLTHEIMNTVSPIASLSDALSKSMDENGHSELDIKAGLETISDSSKNLIGFVQTYRQLSGVAKPIRRAIVLKDLMENVIGLNSELAAGCGAACRYRPDEEDLMIYADEGQVSQIFINLIKNALQAGAKSIARSRFSSRSTPPRRKAPESAFPWPARLCVTTTAASSCSAATPPGRSSNSGSGNFHCKVFDTPY